MMSSLACITFDRDCSGLADGTRKFAPHLYKHWVEPVELGTLHLDFVPIKDGLHNPLLLDTNDVEVPM
jgi:hypothetical protein